MKSMTELAGGELCLPHRPHNHVGAAARRRSRPIMSYQHLLWSLRNLMTSIWEELKKEGA